MNPKVTIENYKTLIGELLYKLFLEKYEHERELVHNGITYDLADDFYADLGYDYELSTLNQIVDSTSDLYDILKEAHKKYNLD